MPRVRRVVLEARRFWLLTWPAYATVILLGFVGVAGLVAVVAGLVAMLGVAWQRDRRATRKVVELRRWPTAIVHVYRDGRRVDTIVFAGRPNPFEFLPEEAPSLALASAAIIEYVAGDIDVDRLEAALDFYLRGHSVRGPAETVRRKG